MAATRSKSQGSRLRARSNSNKSVTTTLRIGIWSLIALPVLALLLLCVFGLRNLFLDSNPRFTLETVEIHIEKGSISQEQVFKHLKTMNPPTLPGESNLFSLEPGSLRTAILSDSLVKDVDIRRRLPATLDITVYGRTPVAQLIRRGGYLIDTEGVVLPRNGRDDMLSLPVIIGIRDIGQYQPGDVLENPMVQNALALLKLKSRTRNGQWLNVKMLQLDDSHLPELILYLRRNREQLIQENCILVMPAGDRMPTALVRSLEIIETRAGARQPTGFINSTYERTNVLSRVPNDYP